MEYPQTHNYSDDDNSRSDRADSRNIGSALQAISGTPWAIREEALETIINIAARENAITPQALQERLGRRMENARKVRVRETPNGPVAVIPVTGPIFKGANLFTEISGATSNEDLVRDIARARDDNDIAGIVLNIDSPGGTVGGTQEVAQTVYDARSVKPITAYVDGEAASGAYWIASAAERIVMSRTAMAGSIGVVATMQKNNDKNYREIVSSASPNKRPDVDTEEGYQEVLAEVDALANEFIADVARFRQVTENRVRNYFGKGGMRIGKAAVKAKMADDMQNRFEKFLPTAAKRPAVAREPETLTYKQAVAEEPHQPEQVEQKKTEVQSTMGFRDLLGKGREATESQETEAQQKARAERLQAAFPDDEKFAEAQFEKGHDVANAVKAKVAEKDQEIQSRDEALKQAQTERDTAKQELEAAKADAQKHKEAAEKAQQEAAQYQQTAQQETKRANDAENRTTVIGGEGEGTDDHDAMVKSVKEGFENKRN